MALVPMKKLSLIGLESERKLILEALQFCGCVELKKTSEFENVDSVSNADEIAKVEQKLSDLEFVIELVEEKIVERAIIAKKDKRDNFEKPKKGLFFARKLVDFEKFVGITMLEYELFALVDALKQKSNRLLEIKAETMRLNNQIEQLKLFSVVKLPFSRFVSTKNTKVFFGQIPSVNALKFNQKALNDQTFVSVEIGKNLLSNIVCVLCHNEYINATKDFLNECGFVDCPFNYEISAQDKIEQIKDRVKTLEAERREIIKYISSIEDIDKLKLLYDYYSLEVSKAHSISEFKCTAKTFIMEAWFPENCEDLIKKNVYLRTRNVQLFVEDPKDNEEMPTLTKNVKIIQPFESVTNMYSVPSAREKDPNIFLSIFFFIFFGLMLSDAGYGIVLTLSTFILMKCCKMEKGMKQLMFVVCMGGISTLIWGTLFGTWFGFDVKELGVPVLQNLVWIQPISGNGPIVMLVLCLGLGVVQILFGMGVKAVQLLRQKKIIAAIGDVFSWYIFFVGVLLLILSMLSPTLAILNQIGLYVMIAGLALVLIFGGHARKGILGKITGGLGSLYNIVNLLSDILSYSRIFGLGVATGVVGLAMNTLAGMVWGGGSILGIILGAIVFLIGHVFNLAINLLGAYIHNARLQYVEFFGKFYTGGGWEFNPLGSSTKYYQVK